MDGDVQTYVSSQCREEGYVGRIEVVTGPTGRRRWPDAVKARIVAETFRDGVSVADVARRHDVSAPQLHSWRRQARDGLLPMIGSDADPLGLIPVTVAGGSDELPSSPPGGPCDHSIAVEVGGVRIVVPPDFDEGHLVRVLCAVRGVA